MNSIFAKRRARLLAMKAIRDNQAIPGEKTVTCPHCQQVSDRKIVAQGLSVCPKCGYHFPIGAYYRLSTILDPGSFKELFARYPAGDPLNFPGYRAKLSAAQRIVYQLDAAGVPITLKSLPFEEFTAALQSGDFDLYLGEVVLTADFDLTALLSPEGTLNYGRWQDSQFPALLTAFLQATDTTREGAAYALYNYLCQQMPIAPICFKNGSVLTQWGRLSGLSPVRGNVFYQLENWTIS